MNTFKYILLLILFLNIEVSRAQSISELLDAPKKEVFDINNQELYKAVISFTQVPEFKNLNTPEYDKVDESVSYVYFDLKGRIRKFVHLSNHPEGQGYVIHYFDSSGSVVYTIHYETSGMEEALVGTRYFKNGKLIYTDIQLNNEEDGSNTPCESNGGEFIPTGRRVYDITNTKKLKDYCKLIYNNKDLIFSENYQMVRFVQPNIDDKTIVNARRVNIRQEPTRTSTILSVAGLGTSYNIVQIKEVDRSVSELWFRIEYGDNKIGYILGDYLEPVEKEVK